ncbi:MAG: hypothetical protein COB98_01095 [Flavobacteriaceae bacterium]|nr:MAG: hypothetical protein COB98_01095 [Flavobacteriaceae bacterium]
MKKITYIIALFTVLLAVSCNCSKDIKTETNTATTGITEKKIVHVAMNIEGMTCEIGCAKIIESKVSKLKGIQFSQVNFEAKKGIFSFDANQISKEDISAKINGIAGGDLYKVTHTKTLDSIPNQVL